MRLGDLIEHEDFGLTLVNGGPAERGRSVLGAHVIEAPDPVPWLAPDWVMLTAGLRLRRHPDEQRRVVREVAEGGITAMGFAVDIFFRTVPKAMLEEAKRVSLPIFTVPYELPFRDIVKFVNQGLVSDDINALRRLNSMQRHLMTAIDESDPEQAVVERLAARLDADISLLERNGDLVARAGARPPQEVLEALARADGNRREDVAGVRWSGVAMPIDRGYPPNGWLVAGSRRNVLSESAKAIVEVGAGVLTVVGRGRRMSIAQDQAIRSALLRDLIDANASFGTAEFRERLRLAGFEVHCGYRTAVIASPDEDWDRAGIGAGLEAHLVRAGEPYLHVQRDDELIVLMRAAAIDEGMLPGLLEALAAVSPGVLVGVSRELERSDSVGIGIDDGRLAVDDLVRSGARSGVRRFEDLDFLAGVLARAGVENLTGPSHGLIDPLQEKPGLIETLQVYFDCSMNVGKAAKRLYIHPNSLRYRLKQIEELIGRSLTDPAAISEIYLGLHVLAISADRVAGPD